MEMTTVQFVHFQFENLEASRLKTSCLNLCKLAMQADKGEQTEGERLAKNSIYRVEELPVVDLSRPSITPAIDTK